MDPNATREIVDVSGETTTYRNLLVTTRITAPGQIGAPVVDAESRIVGVSFAGGQSESLSIAIERVQLDFPDAF